MLKSIFVLTLIVSGWASRYDPGVFETVISNRQNDLTSYSLPRNIYSDRYIALADCSRIGDYVLIDFGDNTEIALVADCAGVGDGGLSWMIRNNIAGELDPVTYFENRTPTGLKISIYEIGYVKNIPHEYSRSSRTHFYRYW